MILPPGATDCHSKGGRDKEASGGVGTDAGLFKSQFAVTENIDVCDDCLNWGTISCSIGQDIVRMMLVILSSQFFNGF